MRTLALSAVMLLTAAGSALAARPGTLDKSFGGDGRVDTQVAGGLPTVGGVESLPGGKTLVVGTVGDRIGGDRRLVLIRYRRDGRLDRGFGDGGVRSFYFDHHVTATDTLLDAEGRLVVLGGLRPVGTSHRTPMVVRFDRSGNLDPSFDQDGIALIDFAGGGEGASATAIALSPDGSIVVTASISESWPRGRGLGVARLDTSGALDPTFGDRGLVRTFVSAPYTYDANAVGVEADGRIAIAAILGSPASGSSYLVRLLRNGSPDTAFGDRSDLPGAREVAGPDASAVIDLVVDRLAGRVVFAGTFCGPGCAFHSLWVRSAPGSAPWGSAIEVGRRPPYIEALELDPAGRAVVAGSSGFHAAPPDAGRLYGREYAYMLVARLTRAGKVDRCFGRRGVARVWFPNKLSQPAGLAVTAAGKIVIAGPLPTGASRTSRTFQVARLHGGACPRR